jgi:hypothetical protein
VPGAITCRHPRTPVSWVITTATPRQSPQVGVELISPGALQQGLLDLGELGGRQLGIGAVGPDCARIDTALLKTGIPDMALWWDTPSSLATSAWVRPRANSSAARSRRASRVTRLSWDWDGGWSTSPDPHTASTQPSTHLPDVMVGCGVTVPGPGWASGAGLAGSLAH